MHVAISSTNSNSFCVTFFHSFIYIGPISLCVDLFVFIYVYFVFLFDKPLVCVLHLSGTHFLITVGLLTLTVASGVL